LTASATAYAKHHLRNASYQNASLTSATRAMGRQTPEER
jgi:hypothetical protein